MKIDSSPLKTKTYKNRLLELTDNWYCNIKTQHNMFHYKAEKGFLFDARSGGKWVDWIVPWTGRPEILRCWMVHDLNYYGFLPFGMANNLLERMLLQAHFNYGKTELVFWSVRAFGKSSWTAVGEYPGADFVGNMGKIQLILNDETVNKTPHRFRL